MGYTESILETFLTEVLNAFVRTQNLGLVSGASGLMRLWPGRVRIPDLPLFLGIACPIASDQQNRFLTFLPTWLSKS